MIIRVDWQVMGSSTIDISDAELREAADAGVDLEDYDAALIYLEGKYGKQELYRDIVDEFDEMDAPEIISASQEGQPPDWWYDEYIEEDENANLVLKNRKEGN